MSRTRPLHPGETLDESDALAGLFWEVQPEHAGHIMSVVGRIIGSRMFIVACSCGDEFRMAAPTIERMVAL